MTKVCVTLDTRQYQTKPKGAEIAKITRRLQLAGGAEIDPRDLTKAIAHGMTFCGGCYEPSKRGWGAFVGQQLFPLDIDNHEGKRDLQEGDKGYLGPWEALRRWRSLFGCYPLIMYPSFSFEQVPDLSKPPTKTKFRLVFDAGELIESEARARDILCKLLRAFPEADPACKNPNRLFFGASSKAVCFTSCENGGAYYARRA